LLNREDNQYQEKLLKISRVSKTTKGGRTISFSVLAAVGDGEGKIGLGLGKANGVPDAIRKAVAAAKKNIVKVSLKNNTIPHEITGKWGATTLWMAPAYEGTGVIAGSASREILELVGVHDILTKIKGVQEVRLDNDWMEKLTALSWLIAHVAIFCTVLMTIAVFLVIGNSIRSDVYSSRSSIDVMKLLGATDQFILRPYLYTGMIYAVLGGLVAAIFSSFIISYFTSAVKYVTDIFAVQFSLNGLGVGEFVFLLVCCLIMGYVGAWIVAKRHITLLDNHH